jgi:hypothetical protein
MRQARLSSMHPLAIHPIAITHQYARPVLDQGLERRFAPARLYVETRRRRIHHHPQPGQHPRLIPGGLIHVVDLGTAGPLGNGLVMRLDGFGDAIHAPLNRAPTDRDPQDRGAKRLHRGATVSLPAGQFPDEGRQPGSIAVALRRRKLGCEVAATPRATGLVQGDVLHDPLDLGQLDHLVGSRGSWQGTLSAHKRRPQA